MKKILLIVLIIVFSIVGKASAQYVAQSIQNQWNKDQAIIDSCENAINTANADQQSILNDNSAYGVTNSVPAIATQIQAIQAQTVSVSVSNPATNMSVEGTN